MTARETAAHARGGGPRCDRGPCTSTTVTRRARAAARRAASALVVARTRYRRSRTAERNDVRRAEEPLERLAVTGHREEREDATAVVSCRSRIVAQAVGARRDSPSPDDRHVADGEGERSAGRARAEPVETRCRAPLAPRLASGRSRGTSCARRRRGLAPACCCGHGVAPSGRSGEVRDRAGLNGSPRSPATNRALRLRGHRSRASARPTDRRRARCASAASASATQARRASPERRRPRSRGRSGRVVRGGSGAPAVPGEMPERLRDRRVADPQHLAELGGKPRVSEERIVRVHHEGAIVRPAHEEAGRPARVPGVAATA